MFHGGSFKSEDSWNMTRFFLVNMTLMRKPKTATDSFLLYSARHQSSDVTKAALSLFS